MFLPLWNSSIYGTNSFPLLPASGISKTSPSSVPSNLSILSYSEASDFSNLPTPRSEGEILSSPNLKAFTFNELKNATRNFRPDSLLGEGGFGYVYKGWIDEHTFTASKPGSGMVVAVKKLKPEGLQGHKEWLVSILFPFRSLRWLKHTLHYTPSPAPKKCIYFFGFYWWSN